MEEKYSIQIVNALMENIPKVLIAQNMQKEFILSR
jgi:hypothetical protein